MESAPAPWRQGRTKSTVLESFTWKAARRSLAWPSATAIVVAIGAVTATQLVQDDRPVAAAIIVACISFLGASIANVLVSRAAAAQSRALRDPLTGLPNRALLDDRIEQALARSQRSGEPFALFVVDLDGFKSVNDVRGHEAGNVVLRTISRRFQGVLRGIDTVARVGGDEFVVLSVGTGTDEEASALVGRLRKALRRPYRFDGGLVEIDASIGWAIYPQDALSGDDLIAQADGRMYATKRDTSDESVVRRPALDGGIVRDLEAALERDEIVVHYQPIVQMRTGAVHGVEALVRRLRSDRLVAPSEFLPHLEHTPVVRTLTLAVAADALRRLTIWDAEGHPLTAAVNVPYRMLDDASLVGGLETLLERSSIAPERLTLEIVPSGPGAGSELDAPVVQRLRALGVKLSLDDLGRASSVAAIRVLPLDQVKVDAMFLHDLGRGERSDAIARSLVELARRLGLETVAEGVESRRAWDAASDLGFDLAQGFFFGHPMSADDLSAWLTTSWPAVALAG